MMPKLTGVGTRSRVEGAAELQRALADMSQAVATKIGTKAIRDPAVVLRDELIASAPYDPSSTVRRTKRKSGIVVVADYGHLRDNIRVRKAKGPKPNTIYYRVDTKNAFWGAIVEFGSVNAPPHPWARPVVDATGGALIALTIANLRAGIDVQARKSARQAHRKSLRRGG